MSQSGPRESGKKIKLNASTKKETKSSTACFEFTGHRFPPTFSFVSTSIVLRTTNRIPISGISQNRVDSLFAHFPRESEFLQQERDKIKKYLYKKKRKKGQSGTEGDRDELSPLVIHRRLLVPATRTDGRTDERRIQRKKDGFTQTRVTNNRSVPSSLHNYTSDYTAWQVVPSRDVEIEIFLNWVKKSIFIVMKLKK